MDKDYLVLKRASVSRPSGEWNDDDYDVVADGVVVGRIMKAAAVPAGLSWMRTLAFDYFLIALPALAWFEAHGEGAARRRTMVEAVSPPSPSSPVDVPSGSNGLAAMLV